MLESLEAVAVEPEILPPPRGEALITQAVVAHALGVPLREMRTRSRKSESAFARHVAMYLAHITYGLSMGEVARAFELHHTTVTHACHRIEDMRDDPIFDDQLNWLEGLLRQAARQALVNAAARERVTR